MQRLLLAGETPTPELITSPRPADGRRDDSPQSRRQRGASRGDFLLDGCQLLTAPSRLPRRRRPKSAQRTRCPRPGRLISARYSMRPPPSDDTAGIADEVRASKAAEQEPQAIREAEIARAAKTAEEEARELKAKIAEKQAEMARAKAAEEARAAKATEEARAADGAAEEARAAGAAEEARAARRRRRRARLVRGRGARGQGGGGGCGCPHQAEIDRPR